MKHEINILKLKVKQQENMLEMAKLNIKRLRTDILNIEYPFMEWNELKAWLIKNRPQNDYTKNPTVTRNDGYTINYCFINEHSELQIGRYRYDDFFKRGEPIRVHYQFKSWR